jgi:hypothetical protein
MDNKVINTVKFELEFPDSCDFLTIQNFIMNVEESAKNVGGELVFKNHETRYGSFLNKDLDGSRVEYCYKKIHVRHDVNIGGHKPPVFLLETKDGDCTAIKRTLLKNMDALYLRLIGVAVEYTIESPVKEKMQTIDQIISSISDKCLFPCCDKNNFVVNYSCNAKYGDEITLAVEKDDWEKFESKLNDTKDLGDLVLEQLVMKEIERIESLNTGY